MIDRDPGSVTPPPTHATICQGTLRTAARKTHGQTGGRRMVAVTAAKGNEDEAQNDPRVDTIRKSGGRAQYTVGGVTGDVGSRCTTMSSQEGTGHTPNRHQPNEGSYARDTGSITPLPTHANLGRGTLRTAKRDTMGRPGGRTPPPSPPKRITNLSGWIIGTPLNRAEHARSGSGPRNISTKTNRTTRHTSHHPPGRQNHQPQEGNRDEQALPISADWGPQGSPTPTQRTTTD